MCWLTTALSISVVGSAHGRADPGRHTLFRRELVRRTTSSNAEQYPARLIDDTYNLAFVFDDSLDSGTTATSDKQIIVSAAMSSGNALAIATAINNAGISNTQSSDGDGGANMSSVASATAVGKVAASLRSMTAPKSTSAGDGNTLSTGALVQPLSIPSSGAQKTLMTPTLAPLRSLSDATMFGKSPSCHASDDSFTVAGTGSAPLQTTSTLN